MIDRRRFLLGISAAAVAVAVAAPAAASDTAGVYIYDVFVWNDENGPRLSRGPEWVGATERDAKLACVDGAWVNDDPIVGGPERGDGVYLGTIRLGTRHGANRLSTDWADGRHSRSAHGNVRTATAIVIRPTTIAQRITATSGPA